MSKRHFYFWILWHQCFLCLGAIDIYRYAVNDDEIVALICGSIMIPLASYCIFRVIEGRFKDEEKRIAGE